MLIEVAQTGVVYEDNVLVSLSLLRHPIVTFRAVIEQAMVTGRATFNVSEIGKIRHRFHLQIPVLLLHET